MAGYYETLGVPKTATADEIKKAYRSLARDTHPDRNPGDKDAEARFKQASEAYEILSNPSKRVQYDSQGFVGKRPYKRPPPKPPRQQPPPKSNYEAEDTIHQTANVFAGGLTRGANIQVQMEVTLIEAASGCNKRIKINRRGTCQRCGGRGGFSFQCCIGCGGVGHNVFRTAGRSKVEKCHLCGGGGERPQNACKDCLGFGFTPAKEYEVEVTLPPGISNGQQVRIPGCGEPGRQGVPAGDLMVVVLTSEHPLYKLKGLDLHVDAWLSFTELVTGTEFVVPGINGGGISVKIPPGTNSGTKFRVRKMGFRDSEGDVGDLLIIVRAETPKDMSDEYKEVITKLKELEDGNVTGNRQAFRKILLEQTK